MEPALSAAASVNRDEMPTANPDDPINPVQAGDSAMDARQLELFETALVSFRHDGQRTPAGNRVTPLARQVGVCVEELVAWAKTLASAAIYATVIVTFGFQVARVDGLSMAPTLADQD